jgi:hypothetical protein
MPDCQGLPLIGEVAARSADGEVFQKNFLKKVDERMKMRYTVYC